MATDAVQDLTAKIDRQSDEITEKIQRLRDEYGSPVPLLFKRGFRANYDAFARAPQEVREEVAALWAQYSLLQDLRQVIEKQYAELTATVERQRVEMTNAVERQGTEVKAVASEQHAQSQQQFLAIEKRDQETSRQQTRFSIALSIIFLLERVMNRSCE
jgi:DNA repair exonuclease SbcCD ATPase subunit